MLIRIYRIVMAVSESRRAVEVPRKISAARSMCSNIRENAETGMGEESGDGRGGMRVRGQAIVKEESAFRRI